MGINISAIGTSQIKTIANTALESKEGVQMFFKTKTEALQNRNRFMAMRKRERIDSRKIYPPESPMSGASAYDALETAVYQDDITGEWVLVVRNINIGLSHIKVVDIASGEVIKPEDFI